MESNKLVNEIATYKTEATQYKTKLGLTVSTNDALVLQTQEQIKSMMAATNDTIKQWLSKFKSIKGGVVMRETTIIKEVQIPFETKIPCDFKPFKANKILKDYQFYSTIANTGLTIDSVKIPNEAKIVIGERKDGIFKAKKMVVDVNNSNPYIQTSNISGYVYEPKKKWYERTWVKLLTGAAVGAAGAKYVDNKFGK
jgi:antitoxin component of RelBE/YafQ-DinJ toxin-antitoxin module